MFERFEKPEHGEQKLSRREFLKAAGGGLMAFGLGPAGAFLFETSTVQSREIKEGSSWAEGIEALREEALHADMERSALFVTLPGKDGEWKHHESGKKVMRITGMQYSSSPQIENIRAEIAAGAERITSAHTHPLVILESVVKNLPAEYIEETRKGSRAMPPIPPSREDCLAAIYQQYVLSLQSAHFTKVVVEPSGVWIYRVIETSEFVKDYQSLVGLQTREPEASEETETLRNARHTFNKKHYAVLKALYYEIPDYISRFVTGEVDDQNRLIEIYKTAGIQATHYTYDAIRTTEEDF